MQCRHATASMDLALIRSHDLRAHCAAFDDTIHAGRTYPKASAPSTAVEMPLPTSVKLDAAYLKFLMGELALAQFSYAVKADPPTMAEPAYAADSSEESEVYEAMPAMPALEAP